MKQNLFLSQNYVNSNPDSPRDRFLSQVGSSASDILTGVRIGISPKVFEKFECLLQKNNGIIDQDAIDEYFYPTFHLDNYSHYSYQDCRDALGVLEKKLTSLQSLSGKEDGDEILYGFWEFRKLPEDEQKMFIKAVKKLSHSKNDLSLLASLNDKQRVILGKIIEIYNSNKVIQNTDGTYFAKNMPASVIDLVTKANNQESKEQHSIRERLEKHVHPKKQLNEIESKQLRAILTWYSDRRAKERKDIAALPGISLNGYQDNPDDYIDSSFIGKRRDERREALKMKITNYHDFIKNLIEMFSAWIIERIMLRKKHPCLGSIRVISTTPSDDCFSGEGKNSGGIDCIALIDSPDLAETTPIGIDIVNTLNDDYLMKKGVYTSVIPRNFLGSFPNKQKGIGSLSSLDRYSFNVPLNQIVFLFQKFVIGEISNICDDTCMEDRGVRQNTQFDSVMDSLRGELLKSLTNQEGITRNIVNDVSQASQNILHASGKRLPILHTSH